ncbi:hypothetical protein [Dapis sp. BLCC M229]|uniref:hypothetical protein n=1 Tax=Dapis sp. BLCC M229 TaxID=3400188 RepID=UPI003CF9F089|nr:hypothetical protein [Trichodesmium sp. MO_231.B1]
MKTLLLIQSITFLTFTLSLNIRPKQVMAVPNISHYPHQVDTDVGSSLFQSLSEKSIFSTVVYKEEEFVPEDNGKPDTDQGGGGR